MNVICSHCGSGKIVRNGLRKSVFCPNQKYLCINCGKHFSIRQGKFKSSMILSALTAYNSGKTLATASALIRKNHKVSVDPTTIY